MRIYILGKQGNLRSITLFHAMARLGLYGLVVVEPAETFVSVGYFDKTPELLDLDKCRKLGIPVIRREVGGGAVLLHEGQVFYQLILPRNKVPFRVQEAYKRFSVPVIKTYKRLGLEVEYKPVNDIVVSRNKKKISGQGAADIEDSFVFVGGVLVTFNHELMAQLFKVSDESLRPKIYEYLKNNVTSLEIEIGYRPPSEEVARILIEEFSEILDFKGMGALGNEVYELADSLKKEFTSHEVLFEDTGRKHRVIKIKEGLYVRVYRGKVMGRNAELELITDGRNILKAKLRLEVIPENRCRLVEKELKGTPYEKKEIEKVLDRVVPTDKEILLKLLYSS